MIITYGKPFTHKVSGWTRAAILHDGCGHGTYKITPTDGSGDRVVDFMSAGSWSNNPRDDRANINRDRIVLCDGAELPPWAVEWLSKVNAASCAHGREALRAALDDADANYFGRDTGW